ncbi:hypothetical protein LTR17_012404 [Elasticomyces elasticus]|nr:hypothetical protein LTR17_012404 [Elasticomyces elasticus]
MSQPNMPPRGPPYAPTTAAIGGLPTVPVDVPICAVFLALYFSGTVANLATFKINWKHGHHFLISWALGGAFCGARVLTCIMRIVWAVYPTNVSVAIAAQILNNAGILMVYVVNLLFALRILRARHPSIGWNRLLHWTCITLYTMIGVAIAIVISMIVLSAYTLNHTTLQAAHDVQLVMLTYITIFAFLAPLMLLFTMAMPALPHPEHFGEGSMSRKVTVLALSTALTTIIASFRVGTTWQPARSRTNPAWYDSRAAFYCFGFMIEIMIVVLFLAARVDKLFYVPAGSSKRQSYLKDFDGSTRSGSTVEMDEGKQTQDTC